MDGAEYADISYSGGRITVRDRRCEFSRIIVSLSRNGNQWLTPMGWRADTGSVALPCDNTPNGLEIAIRRAHAAELQPGDVLDIMCKELGFRGRTTVPSGAVETASTTAGAAGVGAVAGTAAAPVAATAPAANTAPATEPVKTVSPPPQRDKVPPSRTPPSRTQPSKITPPSSGEDASSSKIGQLALIGVPVAAVVIGGALWLGGGDDGGSTAPVRVAANEAPAAVSTRVEPRDVAVPDATPELDVAESESDVTTNTTAEEAIAAPVASAEAPPQPGDVEPESTTDSLPGLSEEPDDEPEPELQAEAEPADEEADTATPEVEATPEPEPAPAPDREAEPGREVRREAAIQAPPQRRTAPSPATFVPSTRQIRALQDDLTAMRYYNGPITGELDPATLSALGAFKTIFNITSEPVVTRGVLERASRERESFEKANPPEPAPAPTAVPAAPQPEPASPAASAAEARAVAPPPAQAAPTPAPSTPVAALREVAPPAPTGGVGRQEDLRIASRIDPVYPKRAARSNAVPDIVEVTVVYDVDAQGQVVSAEATDVNFKRRPFDQQFRDEAARVVRGRTFEPLGVPVNRAEIKVKFAK